MSAPSPRPAPRTPVSTYRLQLGPDLTFDDARALLPYLDRLGVTDLYLSPVLTAAPGSTHGYDVVDHSRISDVLGGRPAFERLARAAHDRGLCVVLDIVPNHMAVPTPAWHNTALWSVLGHGQASPYASWFDVDWSGDEPTILMPVLGSRIGTALARGEIVPDVADVGGLEQRVLRYHDHVFPVRAGTESLPLAEQLETQHYRLAYWRVANEELNYRRFFDVGTLVALRVERDEVFEATHALVLELVEAGLVDGLRVDHPDGLADPRGYLRRLDERTGGAWVAAEKILEADEELPGDWPVAGTTGYDAAWRINQVLHDPAGAVDLAALMHTLTGDAPGGLADVVEAAKRQIVAESLYAEVHRLTTLLADVCADDIRLRDHTWRALQDCLVELLVAFDRYRAYVVPGEVAPPVSEHVVAEAAQRARERLDAERGDTLDVVVDLVLGREAGSAGRLREARRDEIVVRFQQVCGAVMAKGVEDTAFYRWTHLVSLCEVGGSPGTFAIGPDVLHAWAARAQARWPAGMTAGTTHDTKRGADVRARLGVLSEYAGEWTAQVGLLRTVTEPVRPAQLDGRTENLLWQTLAGTWTADGPIDADRLTHYLLKAAREAKDWTSWTDGDEERERDLVTFATAVLAEPAVRDLMLDWVRRTERSVRTATLGQVLLQLTLPGVADVYQGTETTTVALVDPDNRRPVDHAALAAALDRLERSGGGLPPGLADAKLALVAAALHARRSHPDAVRGADAGYTPLPTSTGHAVAYARTGRGVPRIVAVVARLQRQLDRLGGWGEHTLVLPEGPSTGVAWIDALAPGRSWEPGSHRLTDLLGDAPVALLVAAP
ncbi:malto-oligosyltrehalose synthase [Beutenbergia cavernae DSM 12333]|uniref:Malto-oligosyltrehalose synthase n=1 Tax=Beutenbergia cavernae (strain ATCC BAA-8 / DSM 12333 / CCUG 43141 / JCM 11478 / NBRC 16432 / NCIMB 13614 / HKI 0122) TaxID=471853 RepID=C5C5N6_BEUC1|nr:malto-oligosyltrehalose synthase [Beutenbergia cavernae]ACQ80227.1 malto-oligosyltrehalose synthase [Beutenbergia cavernae DSM 12333]